MRIIIEPTAAEVAQWTARYIAAKINRNNRSGSQPFVLGLPTGASPIGTYVELVKLYREGKVSFKNVITFNMDEYVGLPEEHPQSYHYFMNDHFFSHIDIKPENINILNGNAPDLQSECADYERRIRDAGGIELFLGGIGADGHVAFNEPFSSISSRTRVKTLTMETIIDNSRFFEGDTNKVPRQALTVGVGTVLDAREVLILATGLNKARAIRHVIEEGVSHAWTLSSLQLHPKALVVCDDPAAYELKVGTFRYFKQIEADHLAPESIEV
jgi:glucosamine-6-phosphate deaminase